MGISLLDAQAIPVLSKIKNLSKVPSWSAWLEFAPRLKVHALHMKQQQHCKRAPHKFMRHIFLSKCLRNEASMVKLKLWVKVSYPDEFTSFPSSSSLGSVQLGVLLQAVIGNTMYADSQVALIFPSYSSFLWDLAYLESFTAGSCEPSKSF